MRVWFLALLVSQAAVAMTATTKQDCSLLDLRDDFLGEVRNQKKISWCYAFAGADMLAHAYQIPEKISAADVAIAYNETKIGKILDMSSEKVTIRLVNGKVTELDNEKLGGLVDKKLLRQLTTQRIDQQDQDINESR
jgi:hypothetical protein